MSELIKKLFAFYLILSFSYCCCAQSSVISGKLKFDYHFGKYYPVKMILTNAAVSDTVIIDSAFTFKFHDIPHGLYQLKTETNYGITGLINLIITNVNVVKDTVQLFPITLFKGTVCEGGSFMLGKKSTKEYYKTGELYATGEYKMQRKYYPKFKAFLWYYKKQGLWTYYYKSGKKLSENVYNNNNIVSFKDFYENGNMKLSGYYNDCKSNEWSYYSEDGKVVFKITYNDPILNTISFEYLKNYMENYNVLEN